MDSISYLFFKDFVFRTPLFPFESNLSPAKYKSVLNEAIMLASPELYKQITKPSQYNAKCKNKLELTINKYFTRSSFRCTPFGLFAGCSIGTFGDFTDIELVNLSEYRRTTRLDMTYLTSLISFLDKKNEIKNNLRYYPNDSIYEIGGEIRYIEYYYEKSQRIYQLASINKNPYITKILHKAKNGTTIKELCNSILDKEVNEEDAQQFVEQIISLQLLKSELEISITGNDPLNQIVVKLKKYKTIEKIVSYLEQIKDQLHCIDNTKLGESLSYYPRIETLIKKIGLPYEIKNLFQTDLYKPAKNNKLSKKIINEIYQIITFTNIFSQNHLNPSLVAFQKAFRERYDDQEIPLTIALDEDLGIGYPISNNTGDRNTLIDNLILPKTFSENKYIFDDYTQRILLNKYIDAIQNKKKIIQLTEEDFPYKLQNLDDLPDTLTVFCNLLKNNKNTEEQIDLKFIGGGASGARLFSRFCHLNPQFLRMSKEITIKEQELNPDSLLCEIIHSPHPKSGNIVLHPPLREYEILYLANSGVDNHKQIFVSDLFISLKKGKIQIRSKKLNKQIIPRLTNTQNYDLDSLPIYKFLCDMQSPYTKSCIMFQWGDLFQQFNYFPRVMFKNHILSHEKWRIDKKEIQELYKLNDSNLIKSMEKLRSLKKIPTHVILCTQESNFFINLTKAKSIQIMLNMVRNLSYFFIEECLFKKESGVIKNDNQYFTNEFIFTLYKNQNIKQQ